MSGNVFLGPDQLHQLIVTISTETAARTQALAAQINQRNTRVPEHLLKHQRPPVYSDRKKSGKITTWLRDILAYCRFKGYDDSMEHSALVCRDILVMNLQGEASKF